jgi:ADP-ribose pyrophosphatase YjhB (NUDIX family)
MDDGGRMLLARWVSPDGARWTLPGGGLNFGEDPRTGALRELYEETGYLGRLDALLGVDAEHLPGLRGDDFHSVRVLYRAEVVGGTLTHEVDGSTDRAEWVPVDAFATLDAVELVDIGRRLAGSPGVLLDPPFILELPPLATAGEEGTGARLEVRAILRSSEPPEEQVFGGKVDHGETFELAVHRAVRDAGGPAIEVGRLVGVDSALANAGAEWTLTMTFEVRPRTAW